MSDEELFPKVLAAAALAAWYVSEPHVWDDFIEWCKYKEILKPDEDLEREVMRLSSRQIREIIREVEIQLLAAKIGASLKKK